MRSKRLLIEHEFVEVNIGTNTNAKLEKDLGKFSIGSTEKFKIKAALFFSNIICILFFSF